MIDLSENIRNNITDNFREIHILLNKLDGTIHCVSDAHRCCATDEEIEQYRNYYYFLKDV